MNFSSSVSEELWFILSDQKSDKVNIQHGRIVIHAESREKVTIHTTGKGKKETKETSNKAEKTLLRV